MLCEPLRKRNGLIFPQLFSSWNPSSPRLAPTQIGVRELPLRKADRRMLVRTHGPFGLGVY